MSRMFKTITKTWNVYCGCLFDCVYCQARKAAETRFRHIPRYRDGFTPKLIEEELNRKFKPSQFIFVAYMGDISFASTPQVYMILSRIAQFPQTRFLIQSKDPSCFHRWNLTIPPTVYLGTTIETNRDYHLTKAPPPIERFRQLTGYPHNAKFLSIEPIMDFDLNILTQWVKLLNPDIVEIGADNYHNHLVEPPWWKVERLINNIRDICPKVIEKEGLERLRG